MTSPNPAFIHVCEKYSSMNSANLARKILILRYGLEDGYFRTLKQVVCVLR